MLFTKGFDIDYWKSEMEAGKVAGVVDRTTKEAPPPLCPVILMSCANKNRTLLHPSMATADHKSCLNLFGPRLQRAQRLTPYAFIYNT